MVYFLVYLGVIVAVETVGYALGPALAAMLHGVLILVLLNLSIFKPDLPGAKLWTALALVSLLRLSSLLIPPGLLPPYLWAGVVALPVWVGIGLFLRYYHLTPEDLALRPAEWRGQALIALSGIPLGLLGSLLLEPLPSYAGLSWQSRVLAGLLVLVSVAFTEEVLFRGLLATLAKPVLKSSALPFVSLLYACLYINTSTPFYWLWMGLVGLFWGWCVERTRSLWGVTVAHGLMVILLVVL